MQAQIHVACHWYSPCWLLDIKFKKYSRSIRELKTEFSRSIQSKFTLSCTTQVLQNLHSISELLWYNPTLFPIQTKIQGVFIIFKHFQQNFFFSRTFQVPLKSKIKFQGFSRTSRSSTNPVDMLYHGALIFESYIWCTEDFQDGAY